jgi:hypothetical protein
LKRLVLAAAAAGLLAAPFSAHAMVWTSKLEYNDAGNGGYNLASPAFGSVRIEDGFDNGTTVQVTVTLANAASLFINTGGPHEPFLYNLVAPADVQLVNGINQNFYDGGRTDPGAFEATPFGTFTNKIGCCASYVPGQNVVSGFHWEGTGRNKHKVLNYTYVPAHYIEHNGAANGIQGPLTFFLHDNAGLSFAGTGATFDDVTGKLLNLGTGNHFYSNTNKWWFTADIYDGGTGKTYNIAAKDAFTTINSNCLTCQAVPEPATWTMMISGFGGVGAILRRRRRQLFA